MQDEFHTKINAEFQLGNITETVNNTHKSREKIGQYLRKQILRFLLYSQRTQPF